MCESSLLPMCSMGTQHLPKCLVGQVATACHLISYSLHPMGPTQSHLMSQTIQPMPPRIVSTPQVGVSACFPWYPWMAQTFLRIPALALSLIPVAIVPWKEFSVLLSSLCVRPKQSTPVNCWSACSSCVINRVIGCSSNVVTNYLGKISQVLVQSQTVDKTNSIMYSHKCINSSSNFTTRHEYQTTSFLT